LDWYLGKYGYQSQFTDQPNRQHGDILFESQPGDPGAHGPYRDREQGPDLVMRLLANPRLAAVAGGAVAALAASVALRR
jgi:hypothetical protein